MVEGFGVLVVFGITLRLSSNKSYPESDKGVVTGLVGYIDSYDVQPRLLHWL